MIVNYIRVFFSISFILFFIFTIAMYAKNKNLIKFNIIKLNQSSVITEELLFNYLDYNLDSANFYSKNDIKNFKNNIYDLEKIGIIKDVKLSYSIPNKILVKITNNKPIYIIKTKINEFILDENGLIYDTQFFSSSSSIPKVDLVFSNEEFYQSWNTSSQDLDLKSLFSNINKNQSNVNYLLNAFEILNWFKSNYLYSHVDLISINKHTIDIYLGKTKISFSKNNQEIKNQINKINQIVNNQVLLDSLNINSLTDLEEIKLFFNNQIVIKS